jgi:DNA-binding response OmpR family regulator
MIVEDERTTQRFIKDILKQHSIKSIECFDIAEDALHRVQSKDFDMILMDININGKMNGIELAKKILRIIDLPIVFISGERDTETLENVLKLSPYGFIFKPFSSKEMEFSLQLAYQNYIAQIQRSKRKETALLDALVYIDDIYSYDLKKKKLYCNTASVKLNVRQEKVIEVFCTNLNNTISYEVLSDAVWGESKCKGSALRTLIYTLRKLLPDLPLISYSKVGYSLQTKE